MLNTYFDALKFNTYITFITFTNQDRSLQKILLDMDAWMFGCFRFLKRFGLKTNISFKV